MSDLDGNETLDSNVLGHCERVQEKRLGDCMYYTSSSCQSQSLSYLHTMMDYYYHHHHSLDDFIFFEGLSATNDKSVSVVLRGANDMMLQEMERSFHDAVCVEQRVMESKSLVVGGGAVETALYLHLKDYAMSLSTSEQLAVEAFGKAMLVIPKTLAVNAAKDATELIAQLCARHANTEDPEARFCGLDLVAGAVVNNFKKGVLEPTMNKVKCLKFATEAAITILRIDDMIKINPVVGVR